MINGDFTIILELLRGVLDILLSATFIYFALRVLTVSKKYMLIIVVVISFLITYTISSLLDLLVLNSILSTIYTWGILIIVILFQEEIKEAIEGLGNFGFLKDKKQTKFNFADELADVTFALGAKKTGALICIKRKDSLTSYTKNAIKVEADFSKYLVESIFNKQSPLHDGSIIINGSKITHASTYFPITVDITNDKELGTRHRAAMTLSKEVDAFIIIVSEETGKVSISVDDKLYRNIDKEFLGELLLEKTSGSVYV